MLLLVATVVASAQNSQRQKMIHMAALRIADEIGVAEADRPAFISMYQDYKKETALIMSENPSPSANSEEAAEKKILLDFEKSGKILQLRKDYYFKFKGILTPLQIQKMYDAERNVTKK